jgi:hypothetical protein
MLPSILNQPAQKPELQKLVIANTRRHGLHFDSGTRFVGWGHAMENLAMESVYVNNERAVIRAVLLQHSRTPHFIKSTLANLS